MNRAQLLLLSSLVVLGMINNAVNCIDEERKEITKKCAMGYASGLGIAFTGGILQGVSQKGRMIHAVGRGTAALGSVVFSPIASVLNTGMLVTLSPVSFFTVGAALKNDPAFNSDVNQQLFRSKLNISPNGVRCLLKYGTASALLAAAPVAAMPAVIGLGVIPYGIQQYNNSFNE
jgi:hypothetical protein